MSLALRYDEIDWFERISDGKTVLWLAGASTFMWHATADGEAAVCSTAIPVDRHRDPYPGVVDRSHDVMTCERCAGLVRRIRMQPPSADLRRRLALRFAGE